MRGIRMARAFERPDMISRRDHGLDLRVFQGSAFLLRANDETVRQRCGQRDFADLQPGVELA